MGLRHNEIWVLLGIFTFYAKLLNAVIKECAFHLRLAPEVRRGRGCSSQNGRRLPKRGGQDIMRKKVLFPAWWFLPPLTERSPPH